jgi:hypothetical protein
MPSSSFRVAALKGGTSNGRFGGKRLEPFHFNLDAVADQAEFAEIRCASLSPLRR